MFLQLWEFRRPPRSEKSRRLICAPKAKRKKLRKMKSCRSQQKRPVNFQAARIQPARCTALSIPHCRTKIVSGGTKNAAQLIRAATIDNIKNGGYSFFVEIRFARLRDSARDLPNQLKPITSNQFERAAKDFRFRMVKAPANLATLGRPPQKTPIFRVAKRCGLSNLYKSTSRKPPSYLPTHRREIEKIVKFQLSPMKSTKEARI